MPKFFAWADALLVQLRDDPLFHMTIPSKTLAYMACGRPILCAVAGDGADVIKEAGAGVVCPPSDPIKLAETVLSLYDMKLEDREALGIAGRTAFLKSYTRQVLVDKYESLFQETLRTHS
jgi:colanic acid biosynthesis glycosyl transferase WcaI